MMMWDEIDPAKLARRKESFYGAAFYKTLVSDLTSTFTACSTINTKLVANGKQGNMGKVGEGLQGISEFTPVGGKVLKILGCCCVSIDRQKQMQAVKKMSKTANGPLEMQLLAEAAADWLIMLNLDIQFPKSCFKTMIKRGDNSDEIKILAQFASLPNSYLIKISDSGSLKETIYETLLSYTNLAAMALGEQHGHAVASAIIDFLFKAGPSNNASMHDRVEELVYAARLEHPIITYEEKVHKTAEQILGIIKYKAPGYWKTDLQIDKIFLEKLETAIKSGLIEYDFANLIKTEQSKKCIGTNIISFFDCEAIQKDDLFPVILGAINEGESENFL